MDVTQRRISKIARAVSTFTVRTMRQEGIGSGEFDFIQVVRRHPGITQAEVCQHLEMDKGAAARQAQRLEEKGFLRREPNPADGRSRLLFATEKADEVRHSRDHLEELFYEWLMEPLSEGERAELARLLDIIGPRCREERREGFPNVSRYLAARRGEGAE